MRTAPPIRPPLILLLVAGSLLLQAAGSVATQVLASGLGPSAALAISQEATIGRLPTGNVLDPAFPSVPVGSLPLTGLLSPEGDRLVLLLNGWREQGIQVIDSETLQITQTLEQDAAFLGLAFSPDGRWLYASGGNDDVVYRYAWSGGRAALHDTFVLADKEPGRPGSRYPGGLALSSDGRLLYVAENLGD